MPSIIETDRLILRKFTPHDANNLTVLHSDPIVVRHYPHMRVEEESLNNLDFIIKTQEKVGYSLWATIYKANDKFIGKCGLLPWKMGDNIEIEISYMLARNYWGYGLATEAANGLLDYGFNNTDANRLVALVHPGNMESKRVVDKIGATYVTDVKISGITHLLYAITREEWAKRRLCEQKI